ncbi:Cytochrome d ubiquinol oxidase subunit 1 [Candidatus Rubidus massiliensis]|nr:Cytochrome d ubiquinol oxidase subunit 1 [Candidatus Rubidus massiliensis]
MNVEILARLQFALTIMFHYIYPPLSIGIGLILVIIEGMYLKTKDKKYETLAHFWTKIFALTFAIGVATGIVMEFEFGTNWATYSRYVGDIFGSALAAEGVFAFFLESGFLAILLFGWTRVHPKTHFFATLMVCLGAHFSAIWIVVANSWMQIPMGYKIVGEGIYARAEITDFWLIVLNTPSLVRLAHTVVGCWLAGSFLAISVGAYYLLKKIHIPFAKISLKVGLWISAISLVLQVFLGHMSAVIVSEYQPAKLAAFEGIYKTENGAGIALWGIPNSETKQLDYALRVPTVLSLLAKGEQNAQITGLDAFPEKDWPRVSVVFQTYHLMLYMWGAMVFATLLAIISWRNGMLFKNKIILWFLIFSVLFPQIANQAGWVSAEVGRYPWIVYNLLRISDGLSKTVTANQVLGSIIMFGVVYILLFILFIYLLNEKIKTGPDDEETATPYHYYQPAAAKELTKNEPT